MAGKKKSGPEPVAVMVAVDALQHWDRNPRDNDKAVAKVASSIEQFGWGAPIVAWRPDEPMIIAGHTRHKAAVRLKIVEVPVRWMPHLTRDQALALALADNKLGELAGWKEDEVDQLLADLAETEVDLSALGWDDAELDAILNPTVTPGDAFGGLPTGGPQVSQMTFTIRPDDVEDIRRAIRHARSTLTPDELKAWNGNGQALALLARQYLDGVLAQDAAALDNLPPEPGDGDGS